MSEEAQARTGADALDPSEVPVEERADYADAVEGDAPLPAEGGDPGAGDAAPAFAEPPD